jgi:XTP/dITP diphosphohydrolase
VKELLFATRNNNKVREIQQILQNRIRIISLSDLGYDHDIPEDRNTLEGNALAKAIFTFNKFNLDCFADDTGLEVDALNGSPGVYSARFAAMTGEVMEGEDFSSANIRKLLHLLMDEADRHARFRTVIVLITDGREYLFEGIVPGQIIFERRGKEGFGYDPVFIPDGYNRTFAEMSLEEKNLISHRALAIRKLSDFLLSENK